MELLTEKLVRKIHIEKNDAKFSSQNVDMDAENRWVVVLGEWVSGYWYTRRAIRRMEKRVINICKMPELS